MRSSLIAALSMPTSTKDGRTSYVRLRQGLAEVAEVINVVAGRAASRTCFGDLAVEMCLAVEHR